MPSSTLDLIVQLEDNASSGLSSLGSTIGGLNPAMLAAGAGLAAVGGAIVAVGASAFSMATDVDVASGQMTAALGLSESEAANFESAMTGIFANNYGTGFDDISQSLITVEQAFAKVGGAGEDLQPLTETAFAIRDAFGIEVAESADAAAAAVAAFGIDGDQAMDLIVTGLQSGMNSSGDFLESIGEYSPVFADAGFSADEMYSIMQTGAASGVLGVDKISDAVKEMGVKLNEGGTATVAAFDMMGLSYDDMAAQVAAGETTWADQFDTIVGGLNGIEDPLLRSQAQVAIFGTMAEDLGPSFTEGLSAGVTSLADMEGATTSLNAQYDNWPSMWEGIKRSVMDALLPLGEQLLEIANNLMPHIQAAFAWIGDNLPGILETGLAAFTPFQEGITLVLTAIQTFWTEHGAAIIETVMGYFNSVWTTIQPIVTQIQTLISEVLTAVLAFWTEHGAMITENVSLYFNAALGLITTIINTVLTVISAVLGAVLTFWQEHGASIVEAVGLYINTVLTNVTEFMNMLNTAIQDVLNAIKTFWNEHGADIVAAVSQYFTDVATNVNTMINDVKTTIETVLNAIKGFWTTHGTNVVAAVNQYFTDVKTNIATMINDVKTTIEGVLNGIKGFWTTHGTALETNVNTYIDAIESKIDTVINAIQTTIETVLNAIKAFWDEHGAELETAVGLVWEAIELKIDTVLEAIDLLVDGFVALFEGDWQTFLDNIQQVWEMAWDEIRLFIDTARELILTAIRAVIDAIIGAFTDTDWGAVGQSIVDGVVNAINAGIDSIANAARSAAQSAWDAMMGFLDSGSPSRLFAETAGASIPQGVALGIADNTYLMVNALEDSLAELTSVPMPTLGVPTLAPAPIGASVGGRIGGPSLASSGTSPININIPVDARGSVTPAVEIEKAVKRAVNTAMLEAGRLTDVRIRTRHGITA